MSIGESPPFERGELFTAYSEPGTADADGNSQVLGKTWEFIDKDWSESRCAPERTNRYNLCMALRNDSGGTLLPKTIVKFSDTGSAIENSQNVAGYASLGDRIVVVDEFLPSTGVPDGGIFWGVVRGITKITADPNVASPALVTDQVIIPGTNGTFIAQNVTAGNSTGANLSLQVLGAVGRLLENATVGGNDYLCEIAQPLTGGC